MPITILAPSEIAEKHRKRAQEIISTYENIATSFNDLTIEEAFEEDNRIWTELIAEALQCTENIALGIILERKQGRPIINNKRDTLGVQEQEQTTQDGTLSPVQIGGERPPWE